MLFRGILLPIVFSCAYLLSPAQSNTYILNGSSTQTSCNCYTLTNPINNQSASVWNASKIDLRNSFDFVFNVYLGCKDGDGADGIVFMLQPISTSVGTAGGGMGFLGVQPSLGVALDTWQNNENNDPVFDHISIQVNGDLRHGNDLAGPVSTSTQGDNIEDCRWHTLRISWDATRKLISAYFDAQLRVEAQVDLVTTIFNNDPFVFWGFGAATGGSNNLQQFCTAVNPNFNTDAIGNATCIGKTIQFQNTSASFAPIAKFYWDFGDGTYSTESNPPAHLYTAPGLYSVKLAITALDGCNSDTISKLIAIGDLPKADFNIWDTCSGTTARIKDLSSVWIGSITKWNWVVDGNALSIAQSPSASALTPGEHQLTLSVESNYGCRSEEIMRKFTIKPSPQIAGNVKDGCINLPLDFTGTQLDSLTQINKWDWSFGDNSFATGVHPTHFFSRKGYYDVRLTAVADNGCMASAPPIKLFINEAIANAGNDTVLLKNEAFTLHASGGVSYTWLPGKGLDDPSKANPVGHLDDDIDYKLTVTTAEGCTDDDWIHISIFKGSAVYMPTAFSPDGNGLNDVLRPGLIGIKRIESFQVFNRWGQLLFNSTDIGRGWTGDLKGVRQPTGVYVWQLIAVDYIGKRYELKGTTTLIR